MCSSLGRLLKDRPEAAGAGLVAEASGGKAIWGSPKIGGPNLVPSIVGSLS